MNSTISRPKKMLVAFIERPFLGESLPPNGIADHSLAEKPKVRGKLQMDWRRSEDLKEEKNVTAPIVSTAGVALAGGMCHGHMREGLLPPTLCPQP